MNNNFIPISNWFPFFKHKLLIIAGPCSIETKAQTIDIAQKLKDINKIDIFRAGIWKPRTRPGQFEGIGVKGLQWLDNVKKITNLPIAVEVANTNHIEEVLKHNIDIIWIGARTTTNPFSVQELANALKGVDIPVMIKNPVNPDLDLWIGAIERISKSGINKIAAIHRGFTSYNKSPFRNEPLFEIVESLKNKLPNLPIICDPSHISGNRELISLISQKAIDMKVNGLMIECHSDPDNAYTDSKQQITPDMLNNILNSIDPYNNENNDINDLRNKINNIDYNLLQQLAKRMEIVKKIGQYKHVNKIKTEQLDYWNKMLNKKLEYSNFLDLNKDFIHQILQLIHKKSIDIQNKINSLVE